MGAWRMEKGEEGESALGDGLAKLQVRTRSNLQFGVEKAYKLLNLWLEGRCSKIDGRCDAALPPLSRLLLRTTEVFCAFLVSVTRFVLPLQQCYLAPPLPLSPIWLCPISVSVLGGAVLYSKGLAVS